ncbi:hypothetical protein AX17_001423 [Amanita inopinata Kibby_2008]|nr:hypothetical protein AX17_001423 [Amanita inopinata Kibby_2008]
MVGANRAHPRKASIVLVGMRGVGKTTLATIAACALNWDILDTDILFERQQRSSIASFVNTHGWDAFRHIESEILANVLLNNRTGKIIACGGGVIESEENRQLLCKFREYGVVIHVLREKEHVLDYIHKAKDYPPFCCEINESCWEQKLDLFRACCSFEFASLTVPSPTSTPGSEETITQDPSFCLKPVEQEFFRLLRFIHGVDTNKVPPGPPGHRTYYLALAFDDIHHAIPVLDDISIGIDLWEVRIDYLKSYDPNFLSFQVATLRRHSPLPILFTVRTISQGGRYPDTQEDDNEAVERLSSLLRHALRLGVEYIDLEMSYPSSVLKEITYLKGNTTIIGSYHDWTGNVPWTGSQMWYIYDSIVKMGAGIVKIVNTAQTFEDNMRLRQFAASVERSPVPLLAVNMGSEGKISRALNTVLCPVSHPLLPKTTAPGQISYHECQKILYLTGLLPPKKYYVFGNPIAHSMSPAIHNTAFSVLGLPHTYEVKETSSIEELKQVMASPCFGGASVTIPHSRDIIPLLQHLSHHARIIGAVNTITPITGGAGGFSGDNTDWRAIKTCLTRSLTPAHTVTSSTTALILGAGGSARAALYALYQIGVINFLIFNHLRLQAESLADDFRKLDSLLRIDVLDSLDVPLQRHHPPPTIIVSATPAMNRSGKVPEPIDLGLEAEHLSPSGGVALELAYDRRMTKLLSLARERRADGYGWTSVEGIELLLEQSYEQTRIWTGRRAPKRHAREKVMEAYNRWLPE